MISSSEEKPIKYEEPKWERYAPDIHRIKVDGGYVFKTTAYRSVSTVFVPDVDLQKYQAHLRDAYNQGYKDGLGETIVEPNSTAYNRGFKDGYRDGKSGLDAKSLNKVRLST